MTQVTQEVSIIPSNPADQEAIFAAMKEASVELIKIEQAKAQIKDIVEAVTEKYEIKKKILNKMIKTYHAQNFTKFEQDTDEFKDAYTTIVK